MKRFRPIWHVGCLVVSGGCQIVLPPLPPTTGNPLPPRLGDAREPVDFSAFIKPIFEYRCVRCHSSSKAHAGLDLQNPKSVNAGHSSVAGGRFLVPNYPDRSLIYFAATRPEFHPRLIPDDGWGLTKLQKQRLREWIERGADWPAETAGELTDRTLIETRRRAGDNRCSG